MGEEAGLRWSDGLVTVIGAPPTAETGRQVIAVRSGGVIWRWNLGAICQRAVGICKRLLMLAC